MSSHAPRDLVKLRVGEEHPVRLAGLGPAGYRWTPQIEGDPDVAEVQPAGTEAPTGDAVGGGAQELFTVRALRPGVTRVRFAQRRAWEPEDTPSAGEHVVELHVKRD